MKYCLLLALLLISLAFTAQAGNLTGQDSVRLQSIQADFRQEKQLTILGRPISPPAPSSFRPPAPCAGNTKLRSGPFCLCMKESEEVYRTGRAAAGGCSHGFDAMQVVLEQLSGWLDGRVEENDMFLVGRPDARTILLEPKDRGMARLISSITLRLADREGLLDEVLIDEGSQAFTRLLFSNRILNRELPASLFTQP